MAARSSCSPANAFETRRSAGKTPAAALAHRRARAALAADQGAARREPSPCAAWCSARPCSDTQLARPRPAAARAARLLLRRAIASSKGAKSAAGKSSKRRRRPTGSPSRASSSTTSPLIGTVRSQFDALASAAAGAGALGLRAGPCERARRDVFAQVRGVERRAHRLWKKPSRPRSWTRTSLAGGRTPRCLHGAGPSADGLAAASTPSPPASAWSPPPPPAPGRASSDA